MRVFLTIFLLSLGSFSSCFAVPYSEKGTEFKEEETEINLDCLFFFVDEIRFAKAYFYNKWSLIFGDPNYLVLNAMVHLKIECTSKMKKIALAHAIKGEELENVYAVGLTYDKSRIWFYVEEGKMLKICQTAFIHELVHVAIDAAYNNGGDYDHEGNDYRGWNWKHTKFIKQVRRELCALEN